MTAAAIIFVCIFVPLVAAYELAHAIPRWRRLGRMARELRRT